jgi:hypothetical protein
MTWRGEARGLLEAGATDRLVRLLLVGVGFASSTDSAGDDVLDFRLLRREELGSAEAARAWSKASHASVSSTLSLVLGNGLVLLLRPSRVRRVEEGPVA